MKSLRDFWSIEKEKEWIKSEMVRLDKIMSCKPGDEISEEDKLTLDRFPKTFAIPDIKLKFLQEYSFGLMNRVVSFDGEGLITDEDKRTIGSFVLDCYLKPEETWKEFTPIVETEEVVENVEITEGQS